MKKIIKITESQFNQIHSMIHEAHENFLREMVEFGKQLTEGVALDEGLVDNLSGKFRDLVQKTGVDGLRHAVSAALVAGSLAGVSPSAIASAAVKAGVSSEQAKSISTSPGANNEKKDFKKDLSLLNKRYVISDNDPQKQKHYMKFTGNMSDVVGIEPTYGYPIFAKGSESESKLNSAFANPNIVNGIVNVRGKDFSGSFIECQGLWYTIDSDKKQPVPTSPDDNTAKPEDIPVSNSIDNHRATVMVDFTGLFQGAKQNYSEGIAPEGGRMTPEQKSKYPSIAHYIPDFLRARDKGFRGMSNQEIKDMFANGLKAEVEKGKFSLDNKEKIASK